MKRPGKAGGLLAALLGALFAGGMLTILLAVAIWPGEAKLTAPLFCPDDQTDYYVVTDTYSSEPGETSTNFTLYCVGPRGDSTDVGYARPMLALTLFHTAVIVIVFVVLGLLGRARRRRRGPSATEDALRQQLADQLAATIDDGDDDDDDGGSPIDPDGSIPQGPIIT